MVPCTAYQHRDPFFRLFVMRLITSSVFNFFSSSPLIGVGDLYAYTVIKSHLYIIKNKMLIYYEIQKSQVKVVCAYLLPGKK